jgi:outer membrane protein assembly factor BamB
MSKRAMRNIALMAVIFGIYSIVGHAQGVRDHSALAGAGFAVQLSPNGEARLYVGDQDHIICMDAQTGTTVWTDRTPYGTVDVGPILADGTLVYAGGGGGFTIYGLDPGTGRQYWTKQQRTSLLVAGDGRLYANTQSGRGITAVDVKTGKTKWSFSDPPGSSEDRLFYSHKSLYATDYVLDAGTGHLLFRPKVPLRAVTADSESVFAADADDNLSAAVPHSNSAKWTVQAGKGLQIAGLVASKGNVVVALYDGYPDSAHIGAIEAYNAANGKPTWKQEIAAQSRGLLWNPIAADSDSLYVLLPGRGENDTILAAWNIASGEREWSYTNAAGIIAPIVVVNHEIYANDAAGHIYVIDTGSGKLLRTLSYRDRKPPVTAR